MLVFIHNTFVVVVGVVVNVLVCISVRFVAFYIVSEFISLIFLLISGVLDVEIEFCAIGGEINVASGEFMDIIVFVLYLFIYNSIIIIIY